MQQLYSHIGISRQSHHQAISRKQQTQLYVEQLLGESYAIRQLHPRIGIRKMYYMLSYCPIGINAYEKLMVEYGFKLEVKKNYHKTTYSHHNYFKYDDLTKGLVLNNTNQLWVSDITYHQDFYLTFILDVYSRRIIAHMASDNLLALNNLFCLEMAYKTRKQNIFHYLIHHSDKGSQYCCNAYIKALNKANINISMALTSLDNPYAERLNGIIKNEYLITPAKCLKKLKKQLDEAVYLYNQQRPHQELNMLTPIAFEQNIKLNSSPNENPKLKLFNQQKDEL